MKQQQLTFNLGITNNPSDATCPDQALKDAQGLIYRDAEHHVIQTPVEMQGITVKGTLLFVHKPADGTTHYISEGTEDTEGTEDSITSLYNNGNVISDSVHTGETVQSITAIGNTLIVSFSGRLAYYLYANNAYTNIGDIPTPNVKFRMGMEASIDAQNYNYGYSTVKITGNPEGIIRSSGPAPEIEGFYIIEDAEGIQTKYNDLIVGLYAKNQTTIKQKKGFCEPFCAMAALQMYDGSYTKMTNPVVLLPTIYRNTSASLSFGECSVITNYSLLYCKLEGDYSQWSDIVKDVVVFVTDGVNIYDTSVDQPYMETAGGKKIVEATSSDYLTEGVTWNAFATGPTRNTHYKTFVLGSEQVNRRWFVLQERPQKEICDDIASLSVYRRICSIGTKGTQDFVCLSDKIGIHTLETLTTQEQLKNIDFYSNCTIKANQLYVYNSRLNMASVERAFFDGFDYFLPYDSATEATYTSYVTIKTQSGTRVIAHEYTTTQLQGIYFFYPDPRATHVVIKKVSNGTTTYVCDEDLKEHPALNGAYFLREILLGAETEVTATEPTVNNTPEMLANTLLTSEVNNPFVFRAEGYNTIGTGEIIGMAALTQALSQGQFGQYPLLVFTTEGIWAMALNSTGLYQSIHPMSREVALKENPAITQTDGSIFFLSKKGLMQIVGSQVTCVSEQLNGRDTTSCITNMLRGANVADTRIAYDYRDSLLWLINEQAIPDTAFVYSIKFGTYAFVNLAFNPTAAINAYPDYLLQGDNKKVYSLLERPNPNDDTRLYIARLTSRPLKLENALALKTIIQARHITDFAPTVGQVCAQKDHLSFQIEASNNLQTWHTITSLRGIPWKFYRFTYTFKDLNATDTFAGTILITEERRTNKLR